MDNGNESAPAQTISKYDRLRGDMNDLVGRATIFTKPSTVQTVQKFLGRAETFVVTTCRHDELGDYVFIEYVDESNNVTRLALPPKVANLVHSQRESLNRRRRSQAAKRRAALLTDEDKAQLRQRLAKARKAQR